MELTKVLEKRRSIRAYEPGHVIEKKTLEELIYAAAQAPTWKNSQTGRYYIVTDPVIAEAIKNKCLPKGNAAKCRDASAFIVTAFEKGISGFKADGTPENELGNEWGAYDLGLQNANLLLKAAELGLGTLIMGLRDADALRNLLNIPLSQEITAVISIGYPAVDPKKPLRKEIRDIAVWF